MKSSGGLLRIRDVGTNARLTFCSLEESGSRGLLDLACLKVSSWRTMIYFVRDARSWFFETVRAKQERWESEKMKARAYKMEIPTLYHARHASTELDKARIPEWII